MRSYFQFLAMMLLCTVCNNPAYAHVNLLKVDQGFSNEELSTDSTKFNSLSSALLKAETLQKHFAYTEDSPLSIEVSPGVYWIDDPDDTAIRNPKPGSTTPFGMELELSHLRLTGLSDNAEDVVIASNRGQTQGANGNFTMFHLTGDDIIAENITFGNYCNVDLVYPLNPSLNRKKREEAIVQAQLIICDGDRIVARNCRFISRLNLCPFSGARRALFENCYFECTDDALCGTAVYLGCRFTFYSGKPFYNTYAQGARFLNCDIHSMTSGRQYLVKVDGQVAMVDTRWTSDDENLCIGWTQDPTEDMRGYQYNVTLNGKNILVDEERTQHTVDMTGKELLNGYKYGNRYNVYNLLKGDDGWNPLKQDTTLLPSLPTRLSLSLRMAEIETGKDSIIISANSDNVKWQYDEKYVTLAPIGGGKCLVKGKNNGESAHPVTIVATTPSGLEAACHVNVMPPNLPSPEFASHPQLINEGDVLSVDYSIDLGHRPDQSLITWYRSKGSDDRNPIPVKVTRGSKPMRKYALTDADNGYFIKAVVQPCHNRSLPGNPEETTTTKPISVKNPTLTLETDFSDIPTARQSEILPGFWIMDVYKPLDTFEYDWEADGTDAGWYYGEGMDGSKGLKGLVQTVKGARLMYMPEKNEYGDMELSLRVDPCKTAGQGFGSATGQYMDICVKFDPVSLSGYGLRIIRTPKNDKAVDFLLVKYENGVVTPLTEAVSSVCYRRGCELSLSVRGSMFAASARCETAPEPHRANLTKDVSLQTEIVPNRYGGIGIQHTGSTGTSSTLLRHLKIKWE